MERIIDGTKSELIWDSLVGFDEIPQLLNPSSGWIASTNQDPFKVTDPSDNLNPKDFSPYLRFANKNDK